MDYLLYNILPRNDVDFADVHNFIRDRMRSIRQDFTLQNIRDVVFMDLHEKMARFHILSSYILCEHDKSLFDGFQNTEQLRKVLQSLQEYYDDFSRHRECPNESEFRSYYILSHLQDNDIYRKALSYPTHVFESPNIKFALECCSAMNRRNYVKFFDLVKGATLLEACLLHSHFIKVRKDAIHILSNACYAEPYPAVEVIRILGLDDEFQLRRLCEPLGIQIDSGLLQLKKGVIISIAEVLPSLSVKLIGSKIEKDFHEIVVGHKEVKLSSTEFCSNHFDSGMLSHQILEICLREIMLEKCSHAVKNVVSDILSKRQSEADFVKFHSEIQSTTIIYELIRETADFIMKERKKQMIQKEFVSRCAIRQRSLLLNENCVESCKLIVLSAIALKKSVIVEKKRFFTRWNLELRKELKAIDSQKRIRLETEIVNEKLSNVRLRPRTRFFRKDLKSQSSTKVVQPLDLPALVRTSFNLLIIAGENLGDQVIESFLSLFPKVNLEERQKHGLQSLIQLNTIDGSTVSTKIDFCSFSCFKVTVFNG